MKLDIILITATGPVRMTLAGREAWAMLNLVAAGEKGCTPITNPAPRWSAYVFNLRQRDITIETVTERHGGAFAGNHARYVLRSRVRVLEGAE